MEITDKQLEALDIALKLSSELLKNGDCIQANMVNRIITCILHGNEYTRYIDIEYHKKYILDKCFGGNQWDFMYIKLMQAAFPENYSKDGQS